VDTYRQEDEAKTNG